MLKRVIGLFMVLFLVTGASVSNAANIKDFPRVAIMNFGNKAITSSGLRDHDFSSATEYAIYQLSACGWFDLVDYEQLSTMAKIHSVNMSGLVDPTTAVSMGKFLGAQFMVVGNVTGLTAKENVVGYQHGAAGSIGNAQHVVTANVAMRIVDIETGRIIVAGLGKGSSTSTHTEIVFKKYRNRRTVSKEIQDVTNIGTGTDATNPDDSGDGNATEYDEKAGGEYSAGKDETVPTEGDKSDGGSSGESSRTITKTTNINYEREELDYKITIGTVEVSDIQVRNAISKAVRDAIYGKMGLMTTLNNGKPLKIKTGF